MTNPVFESTELLSHALMPLGVAPPARLDVKVHGETHRVTQCAFVQRARGLERIQAGEEKPLEDHARASYVRIFNTMGSYWGLNTPESMAVAVVSPEEYLRLQELGITLSNEGAATAQAIGYIGRYRFMVLKDAEQFGLRSTHFVHKEQICQMTFQRLRLLQPIERMHGEHPDRIIPTLKASLADVLSSLQHFESIGINFEELLAGDEDRAIQTVMQQYAAKITEISQRPDNDPQNHDHNRFSLEIARTQLLGLVDDYYRLKTLQEKIRTIQTGSAEDQGIGYDETRNIIANYVLERCNAMVRSARLANERLTYTGDDATIFRGALNKQLAAAEAAVANYVFDQNHRLLRQHQGCYGWLETRGETQTRIGHDKVAILSTRLLGHGKREIRDFLLAVSYALNANNPIDDVFDTHHTQFLQERQRRQMLPRDLFTTTTARSHRSWGKHLTGSERLHSGPHKRRVATDYYQLRDVAAEAHTDAGHRFWQDLSIGVTRVGAWVARSVIGIAHSFKRAFVEDWAAWFTVPNAAAAARGEVPGAAAAGAAAPAAAPALEKAPTGLLRPAEVSDVRRWGDQEQREELICLIRQAYCKFEQQAGANGLHLNETIRQLILRQRGEGGIALARPPYRLEAFKPDDVLSAIMSGGENFIDFLQLYYESSPSIALYASAIYLACGFAAIHPKAFLKLSKQLKFFTEWSASTARVMARKEASRFVSAAFMNFKEMLLTLEGLTDGNNALLGHIIAYTRDNPAPVMVGLGAALGFGELLAALPANIPEVSDDKGTVPFFMGAFAVAKGSAVAYEGLASETGERSIVGRTFDLILRTSSWALRFALLLTPIGWILGAIYGKTFIAKPFEELVYGLAWLLLRLTHVITRALKLVGRVVRTFFKTVTEWIFNNTATVMKHPRLVVLLGLGVLVGMLAHVGVVYSLLIGLLGIGVGLVLSLAIPPNPNMTRSRAFNMARLMVGLALLGTAAAVKLGVLSFGFLPTLGAGEFGKVAMLTLVLGVSMVVLSAVVVGVVKAIERSRGKRTGDWAGDMVQVKHQVHREAARMTQSLNAANRYVQNSVARAHCDRSDRILPRTYARADREQFDVPSQMIALPPERRPEF